MTLWHRFFFFRLLKTFLFFLACFLVIYLLIDFSAHGVRFLSHEKTTLWEIVIFYFHTLSLLANQFLSITFLLACLKVLIDANRSLELVALQMAGLSKKRLLTPFFTLGIIVSLILYANTEWIIPNAKEVANGFRVEHSKKKKKGKKQLLNRATLEDQTTLVYQSFDPNKKELFDVFWIKSPDEIWHMKYLHFKNLPLRASFVDCFQRSVEGPFEKKESFNHVSLPSFPSDLNVSLQQLAPFENRSLSTLLSQSFVSSSETPSIRSHLYYKLALPLLPLFVLIAISPVAMRFSRSFPTLPLIAISLFGAIGLMILLDGMLILGENQVIPAALAIWSPILLSLFFPLQKFTKL